MTRADPEIGTNNVGANALLRLTTLGVTIADTVTCAINAIRTLYTSGARNFLFQNVSQGSLRLQTNGLIKRDLDDSARCDHRVLSGFLPKWNWLAQRNATEWNIFMREITRSGNTIASLMLQDLPSSLSGAHIGMPDAKVSSIV